MEISINKSFLKSLNRLKWESSLTYKTYDTIVNKLPEFFKNIWRFRSELWSHRWWDYHFTLMLLKKSLEIQEEGMRNRGIEERISLDKKLVKMQRVIELLKNKIDDNFIDRVEQDLGFLYLSDLKFEETENGNYALVDEDTEEQTNHNRLVFKTAHDLEQKEWEEIWDTLKGNKYKEYKDYDGSDLQSWWD